MAPMVVAEGPVICSGESTTPPNLPVARRRWRGSLGGSLRVSRSATIVIAVLFYYACAVAFYTQEEGMEIFHCIYFATVIVTTVGFGDFFPTTDASKLFTAFLAQYALVIVATVLGCVVQEAITRTLRRVYERERLCLLDEKCQMRARLRRCVFFVVLYVATVTVGTVYYSISDDLSGEDGQRWVNAVYFTVITLTTIGFGDMGPTTASGQAFACVLMLVGIPAFGATLGTASRAIYGDHHEAVQLKKMRSLNMAKFDSMQEFCLSLHEEGIHGNIEYLEKITRFEFLCFFLVRNGAVEMPAIKDAMTNFADLDRDGTGFLEMSDVDAWHGAHMPHAIMSGKVSNTVSGKVSNTMAEEALLNLTMTDEEYLAI